MFYGNFVGINLPTALKINAFPFMTRDTYAGCEHYLVKQMITNEKKRKRIIKGKLKIQKSMQCLIYAHCRSSSTTLAQYYKLKTIITHTRMRQVFHSNRCRSSFRVGKRNVAFVSIVRSHVWLLCQVFCDMCTFHFSQIAEKKELTNRSIIKKNQRELSLYWINSPRIVSVEWIYIK